MNRREVIEYFKTASENRSKAFYDAIQYCNANEDDVREFEETSKAYDMAIKSLEAWDEVLNKLNHEVEECEYYRGVQGAIGLEKAIRIIERKLKEVEE